MARIKFSALVESIQGSIAGTTFQRNAYGFTAKKKPTPTKPTRELQLIRQANANFSASAWKGLTPTDRAAWSTYAENFPIATRLNPDANLNGYNYFLKYHDLRQLVSNLVVLDNPGNDQNTYLLDGGSVSNNGTGVLSTDGEFAVDQVDWFCLLFATPPFNPSKEFISFTPRFMGADFFDQAFFIDFTQRYLNAFGNLPEVGQTIATRLAFIQADKGQMVFFPAQKRLVVGP